MLRPARRATIRPPEAQDGAMHPRILRLPQVLDRTGLSRSSLYRLHAAGSFPRRVQISQRSVGWIESEVDAWLASKVGDSRTAATIAAPHVAPQGTTPTRVTPRRRRIARGTQLQIPDV
jgi:prophage regulatory protein